MSRLDVPYISQLVNNSGGNNCGPDCLAEMLAYRGIIAPTQGAMLYVADIVRDGIQDGLGRTGGYTSFAMLFRACSWFSVDAVWIDTWEGVWASLEVGEPVLLLLDNTALEPRQYPRNADFNGHHFYLVTERPGGGNDSLRTYPPIGPGTYTWDSLLHAVSLIGSVQAMALVPLEETPIVANQDGIISELNSQILALRAEIDGLHGVGTERDGQIAALREEVAARNSDLGALTVDTIPALEARLAQMEQQLREAIALAGKATAQRPTRIELQYVDGSLGYVPEPAP